MPEAPLHILITDPHMRGGGQVTYVTRLAGELTRLGHRVSVGCRKDSVLASAAAASGAEVLDVFHFARGLRVLPWTSDFGEMRRRLRVSPPDILHVNGSQDHWLGAAGNVLSGRRCCVIRTRHNTYPVKNSGWNRRLNRRWTDFQIVVCDVVRQNLARQPPFDRNRMCTIHNGVDADAFRADAGVRAEMRAHFGYGEAHLVCGIAARLVKEKGHVFLFKAAAKLLEWHPNLRVLVLGQGELEGELRQLAQDLGIADIVHFAGFRTDMARCVQAVDICAQPSIGCDTSSFSMKEMMAAEKPVVASDYGGLKEIVYDGVEGLIVKTGEVSPLLSAIRRLAESEPLRRKMGAAGRRRVLNEFTLAVFADRTVAAYRRALARHAETRGRYR